MIDEKLTGDVVNVPFVGKPPVPVVVGFGPPCAVELFHLSNANCITSGPSVTGSFSCIVNLLPESQ